MFRLIARCAVATRIVAITVVAMRIETDNATE